MDRQPEPLPLRILFSLALGSFTMVLGTVIWGLVGYFSDRVFLILGLLIGIGAAAAILLPLRPVSKRTARILLPVVIIAALASILLGELLYIVLFMMRDFHSTPMEAILSVLKSLGEVLASSDSVMSGILGLIGAVGGFFVVWNAMYSK
ncbi:MAG: hypothetical protein JW748_01495 [Anaerolineales bacterium]|nr:hypothetical protein [Anaerolineales bacterium]